MHRNNLPRRPAHRQGIVHPQALTSMDRKTIDRLLPGPAVIGLAKGANISPTFGQPPHAAFFIPPTFS
jgi:hypothetical protein